MFERFKVSVKILHAVIIGTVSVSALWYLGQAATVMGHH